MQRPLSNSKLGARMQDRAIGSQDPLAVAAVAAGATPTLAVAVALVALVIPVTAVIVIALPRVRAAMALVAEGDVVAVAAARPARPALPMGVRAATHKPHIGGEAPIVTARSGALAHGSTRTRPGTRSESRVWRTPPVPASIARAPSCPLLRRSLEQESSSAMADSVDHRTTHQRGSDRM